MVSMTMYASSVRSKRMGNERNDDSLSRAVSLSLRDSHSDYLVGPEASHGEYPTGVGLSSTAEQ
eukprot:4188934-Prymnesium_polylepis.1